MNVFWIFLNLESKGTIRDLENRNLFIPFVQIIETNGREQKGSDSDTMNTWSMVWFPEFESFDAA